jgi:hypothetical protein
MAAGLIGYAHPRAAGARRFVDYRLTWISLCFLLAVCQEVVEEVVSEPEVKAEAVSPVVVKQEAGAAKTEASKKVEATVDKVRTSTIRRGRGVGGAQARGKEEGQTRQVRVQGGRWPLLGVACHVRRLGRATALLTL